MRETRRSRDMRETRSSMRETRSRDLRYQREEEGKYGSIWRKRQEARGLLRAATAVEASTFHNSKGFSKSAQHIHSRLMISSSKDARYTHSCLTFHSLSLDRKRKVLPADALVLPWRPLYDLLMNKHRGKMRVTPVPPQSYVLGMPSFSDQLVVEQDRRRTENQECKKRKRRQRKMKRARDSEVERTEMQTKKEEEDRYRAHKDGEKGTCGKRCVCLCPSPSYNYAFTRDACYSLK